MHQKLSEANERAGGGEHFLEYQNQKPFWPDQTSQKSPRDDGDGIAPPVTNTVKQKPSTNLVSTQAVESKPFPKKIRPNFINLKNTTHPSVCTNGHTENIVLNNPSADFNSASNGELKENNEQQVKNHVAEEPVNRNMCLPSSIYQPNEENGNADAISPESSEISRPPQRTKASKDPAPPLIPKIISRFVSPDATNSPCDSLCSTDSTPWNIDGTETIVENPFKRCKGALTGLKTRTPSFLERELNVLREENKQLRASLKEVSRETQRAMEDVPRGTSGVRGETPFHHPCPPPEARTLHLSTWSGAQGNKVSAPGVMHKVMRSPPGVVHKVMRSTPGVMHKVMRSPPGVVHKVMRSTPGVVHKVMRSTPGVVHKVMRSPPGVVHKVMRFPPGVVHKVMRSTPGVVHKTPEDGAARESKDAQRLRESMKRSRAEYLEHVTLLQMQVRVPAYLLQMQVRVPACLLQMQVRVPACLLQMQVRAHRDDWEAERAEKRMEKKAREEAEEKVALLVQEVQILQQKMKEQESGLVLCRQCGGARDASAFAVPTRPSAPATHPTPPATHPTPPATHPTPPATHLPNAATHPTLPAPHSPLPATHLPHSVSHSLLSNTHQSSNLPITIHPSVPSVFPSSTTNHIPATTNHISPSTSNISPSTNLISPINIHIPSTTSHIPASTNHLPPSTSHVLPTTNHNPPATNHAPSTTNHIPPTINHVPSTPSHNPPAINHNPATINHNLPSTNLTPPTTTQALLSPARLKSEPENRCPSISQSEPSGMLGDRQKMPASQNSRARRLDGCASQEPTTADKLKLATLSSQNPPNKNSFDKAPSDNRQSTSTGDENRFLQNHAQVKSSCEEERFPQNSRSSNSVYDESFHAQSSRPILKFPHQRKGTELQNGASAYRDQSSKSAGAVIRNAVTSKQPGFKNQTTTKLTAANDYKNSTNCVGKGGLVSSTPLYNNNGASNVPLKGWIPVSLMHRIAFGSAGDQRAVLYHKSPPMNLLSESPSPHFKNYSPSLSRESSLTSCSSSPDDSEHRQCHDHRSDHSQNYPYNFSGARPKTHAVNRPTSLDDEHKKAKHRARNILANALPISPVSSGSSTPASSVPRPYMMPLTNEKCPMNTEIVPELHKEFERQRAKRQGSAEVISEQIHRKICHSPPGESDNFRNCEEVSEIIELEINRKSPLIKRNGGSNSCESTLCAEPQRLYIESQSSGDNPHFQTASLQVAAEINGNQHEGSHQKRQQKKLSSNKANTIPASTSNETSRSSSPGMSLTTFALTSEGRGIPGAICFSLHREQSPSKKSANAPSNGTKTPKKELSISEVRIEPRSPKPERSPIEISTKEHWWSVTEEHFTYPEELTPSVYANEALVNSTYVKLQDNGRKDHVAEQRTARVISSLELPQPRKSSAEELNFSKSNYGGSNTNMATLSFTPAVNSPTPSSNKSSVESSKANSPPRSADSHLKSLASKNIASAIISYEIAAKGDRIVYSDRLKPTDVVVKSPTISKLVKTKPIGKIPGNDISDDKTETRKDSPIKCDETKRKTTNQVKKHKPLDTKENSKASHNFSNFPDGVMTNSCKEIICPSCQMIFTKDEHVLFLDHFEDCRGPEFVDM
ncbi:hypothetical protein FHG87_004882 [Trinorchestia longiramus]|nr:hypothetical protein FHG87_004882 [Trinorchestia longiramus]